MISLKTLRAFWLRHVDAEAPLRHWHRIAVHAEWNDLRDVRRAWPTADGVRNRAGETLTVFNIAGNKYRLITRVRYDFRLINIRAVLTHAEYARERWKD